MEKSVPLTNEELEDLWDWSHSHPGDGDALACGSTAQTLVCRLFASHGIGEVEARRREAQGAETREEWRVVYASGVTGSTEAVPAEDEKHALAIVRGLWSLDTEPHWARAECRTVGPWRRVEEE